ncbi:MAG: hypothetical protein LC723_06445 [Actinobacteria bacterium]|nr:hypothetical protein [Actinomycetota bacterium]
MPTHTHTVPDSLPFDPSPVPEPSPFAQGPYTPEDDPAPYAPRHARPSALDGFPFRSLYVWFMVISFVLLGAGTDFDFLVWAWVAVIAVSIVGNVYGYARRHYRRAMGTGR